MPAAPFPGIVQVHPSLQCNLRCRHCYSVSGPEQRGALPVETVLDCLEDCAALGYGVLAASGGEPFLYPEKKIKKIKTKKFPRKNTNAKKKKNK